MTFLDEINGISKQMQDLLRRAALEETRKDELLDLLEQCIGCDQEIDTIRHYLLKKHGR